MTIESKISEANLGRIARRSLNGDLWNLNDFYDFGGLG